MGCTGGEAGGSKTSCLHMLCRGHNGCQLYSVLDSEGGSGLDVWRCELASWRWYSPEVRRDSRICSQGSATAASQIRSVRTSQRDQGRRVAKYLGEWREFSQEGEDACSVCETTPLGKIIARRVSIVFSHLKGCSWPKRHLSEWRE